MTEAILAILDSRSFGSIWFWLLLALAWTLAGRRVVGVPYDVVQAALKTPEPAREGPAGLVLLEWLSLTLPRWRMDPVLGVILPGVAAFLVTVLALLGFVYGLEMAQALVLLGLPFLLLFPLELRLAKRLGAILHAAGSGEMPVAEAALQSARRMRQYRRAISVLSVLVVAVTAYRGALWLVTHPFGL